MATFKVIKNNRNFYGADAVDLEVEAVGQVKVQVTKWFTACYTEYRYRTSRPEFLEELLLLDQSFGDDAAIVSFERVED